MKRQATDSEKISAKHISDKKILVSNIYKQHLNLNKKTSTPIKNGQNKQTKKNGQNRASLVAQW